MPLAGPGDTLDTVTEVKKAGLIWEQESVPGRNKDIPKTEGLPGGHTNPVSVSRVCQQGIGWFVYPSGYPQPKGPPGMPKPAQWP